MKAELQEYLKERKCPKCGDSDVATQFCQEENDYAHDFHDNKQFHNIRGEHIHRHCRNCHFEWPERVIAAQPASPLSQAARRFGAYNLGMESDTGTTPIGAEPTSERQPLRVTGSGGVATAQFSRQAQTIGNPAAAESQEGAREEFCTCRHERKRHFNFGWCCIKECECKAFVRAAASEQGESRPDIIDEEIRRIQVQFESVGTVTDACAAKLLRPAFERVADSKLSAAERTIKSEREIREAEKKILIAEIERNKSLESQLSQARQDAAKECAEIARLQDESGCCGAMVARKIDAAFHLSSESTSGRDLKDKL